MRHVRYWRRISAAISSWWKPRPRIRSRSPSSGLEALMPAATDTSGTSRPSARLLARTFAFGQPLISPCLGLLAWSGGGMSPASGDPCNLVRLLSQVRRLGPWSRRRDVFAAWPQTRARSATEHRAPRAGSDRPVHGPAHARAPQLCSVIAHCLIRAMAIKEHACRTTSGVADGGRRRAPWRLSRSVIDSVCPAGTKFARNADSARLGLSSCRKVTRTQNIRFWRVPGLDGTRRDVRRWPWC